MGGIKMNNSTLPSHKWSDGYCRWGSFELYPMHEGHDSGLSVFRGVMYTPETYFSRMDAVVKAQLFTNANAEHWRAHIAAGDEARNQSKAFNDMIRNQTPKQRIVFRETRLSVMDSISSFGSIFRFLKGYEKCFSKNEYVALEAYIEGEFQTFVDINGVSKTKDTATLQAFCHFCHFQTKGDLVITNIKGVRDGHTYRLSVPNIHSRDGRFGLRDDGEAGIRRFFSNHKCNAICASWPTLDSCPSVNAVLQPSFCPVPYTTAPVTPPPYSECCSEKTKMDGRAFPSAPLPEQFYQRSPGLATDTFPVVHKSCRQ